MSSVRSQIPYQVKLPLRVAVDVVSQGLRIRFGRSVVTILGVVCGIAFLMAMLSGLLIKRGVQVEEALRNETNRMLDFLTAETGPVPERTFAVLVTGPLAPTEQRLLLALDQQRAAQIRVVGGLKHLPSLRQVPVERPVAVELGVGAAAVVVMGSGPVPVLPWADILPTLTQPVVATTRTVTLAGLPAAVRVVTLDRELRPEELERREADAKRATFRSAWIIIISLFVTVIGIANAMLMSVTERFKEIGTMKCLGSLSAFVRRLFLIESAFIGIVGGILGCLGGMLFSVFAYSLTYGAGAIGRALAVDFGALLMSMLFAVIAGVVLAVIAALYPAIVASRMVPADALRSNV